MAGPTTPDLGMRTSSRPADSLRRPETVHRPLKFGSASERGGSHPKMEDSGFVDPKSNSFGVFDGVGGGPNGSEASQLASQTVQQELARLGRSASADDVREAMKKANLSIYRGRWEGGRALGSTTGVAGVIHENADGTRRLVAASVGDSRIWILRKTADGVQLEQLTTDDNEMSRQAQLKLNDVTKLQDMTLGEADLWMHRNKVDKVLGADPYTSINAHDTILNPGDVVLATSDGAHDNLTSREMAQILRDNPNPQDAAKAIKDAAYKRSQEHSFRSKPDDIFAIVAGSESGRSTESVPSKKAEVHEPPRNRRKVDGHIPGLASHQARGLLERIAARSQRTDRATDSRRPARESQPTLSGIQDLSVERIQNLQETFSAKSEEKWGETIRNEGLEAAHRQWEAKMDEKMEGFPPQGREKMASLLADLGVPVEKSDDGKYQVDWSVLSKNYLSVEAYLNKVKTIPDIRSRLGEVKWLANIFSPEVANELFTYSPAAIKETRLKGLIERIKEKFGSSEKADRFVDMAMKRSRDPEHALAEITYDGKMTIEQRARVQEVLRDLPIELLNDLDRVGISKESKGGGIIAHGDSYLRGQNGADLSLSPDIISSQDADMLRLVVFHETMGHQIRGMIHKLNPTQMRDLRVLWGSIDPKLIEVDEYAKQYLEGGPRYKSKRNMRGGIPAAVDEFWASRMAEWHLKQKRGVTRHLSTTENFHPEVQAKIDAVCEQTYEMWKTAVRKPRGIS